MMPAACQAALLGLQVADCRFCVGLGLQRFMDVYGGLQGEVTRAEGRASQMQHDDPIRVFFRMWVRCRCCMYLAV